MAAELRRDSEPIELDVVRLCSISWVTIPSSLCPTQYVAPFTGSWSSQLNVAGEGHFYPLYWYKQVGTAGHGSLVLICRIMRGERRKYPELELSLSTFCGVRTSGKVVKSRGC